jgi:D-tyrosyl-tRNA(Tyr) deacylase
MKVLIQRVQSGSVKIKSPEYTASIGRGYVVLVGFHVEDELSFIEPIAKKLANLRIFEDESGKMNLSILDISGEILIVSQFTLYADTQKGNRPGFSNSMRPDSAKLYYEEFIRCVQAHIGKEKVRTGIFGANMLVEIQNDGPVTIMLEK